MISKKALAASIVAIAFLANPLLAADVVVEGTIDVPVESVGLTFKVKAGSASIITVTTSNFSITTGANETVTVSHFEGKSLENNLGLPVDCFGIEARAVIPQSQSVTFTPSGKTFCIGGTPNEPTIAGSGGGGGGGSSGGGISIPGPSPTLPPAPTPTPTPTVTPTDEVVPTEEEGTGEETQGTQKYDGSDGPDWAAEAVDGSCESGIIDCTLPDPQFSSIVNRAVGYQMLTKGFNVWTKTAASTFTDITEEINWAKSAADTAFTLGWAKGKDGAGKEFLPAQNFTRAEIAVAVNAILGLPQAPLTLLDSYPDKDVVPDWARQAMANMVGVKLIGQGGSKLNPNDGLKKIESIVILYGAVTYAADNDVNVLEVAAERMKTTVELLEEALATGMLISEGKLVPVI